MRTGVEQAKAVKSELAKRTCLQRKYMLVLGTEGRRTMKTHGYGGEGEAELVCDEVPMGLMERVAAVLCQPGTWDVVQERVLTFYGEPDTTGYQPPYPLGREGVYQGVGTKRFTLLVGRKGEDPYEGEEIDVDAEDEREARAMGKRILAVDYEAGLVIQEVIGPRMGLYL